MESKFKYDLGQTVRLKESDETGTVIGRAEYDYAEKSFLIRYRAGDGRQVEQWWTESSVLA